MALNSVTIKAGLIVAKISIPEMYVENKTKLVSLIYAARTTIPSRIRQTPDAKLN